MTSVIKHGNRIDVSKAPRASCRQRLVPNVDEGKTVVDTKSSAPC